MLKKKERLERFKKILVLTLLFVLGIGTLSGFATDYFFDSEDAKSPTYNQNKEEHHLDKFILAVAEVEEIEEETGDEKHELTYLIPLSQQNFLNFIGRNEIRTTRISLSLSHRYTHKISHVYLFRNIRI